jgi:hypothetical protein
MQFLKYTQILRIDHWSLVSAVIREDIDNLDEFRRTQATRLDEDSEDYEAPLLPHAALCAKEKKPVTFQTLEDSHPEDPAFRQLRAKLNAFLNIFFPAYNIPLPSSGRITLDRNDTVSLKTKSISSS